MVKNQKWTLPDRSCHEDTGNASQKADRSYSHLMVASRLPNQLSILYSLFWKKTHQIAQHLPTSGAVIDLGFCVVLESVFGWCDCSLQDVSFIRGGGEVSRSVCSKGNQESTSEESQGSQCYEPGRRGDGVGALYKTHTELVFNMAGMFTTQVWETKLPFFLYLNIISTHKWRQ